MTRVIRLATIKDALACRDINAYYINNTAITFDYEVPKVEEFEAKMLTILDKHPFFVYESDGDILGYAYGSTFRKKRAYQWSAETTVYLHPDTRNKGAGSLLYKALLYTLEQQGYVKFLAGITLPNDQSITFHNKFGFVPFSIQKRIGFKFDQWHDVQWMDKDLYVGQGKPSEIRNVDEVMESVEARRFFANLHESIEQVNL